MEDDLTQEKAEDQVKNVLDNKEVKQEEKPKEEISEIQKADEKIKKLEEMNKRLEENLKKADNMIAENMLRGKSYAGQRQLTEDEKVTEECKKFLEGTGLNPF